MQDPNYQVIIVGAGPAGLAASLTLSAYKISHCLIDANTSAIPKPGDALPPNAKPLLKQLGILDLLDSPQHIPYYGNKSIWGTNIPQKKEFIAGIHGHGYLLDRLHFENQLRQLVQNNSSSFYKGYKLKKVQDKGNLVEVVIQKDSKTIKIQAPYIVDATGRKASVCRHLGVNKIELDVQLTLSFWHQLKHKIPRQIWIEATENGWWYISPNAENQANCMFFTLKELVPQRKEIVPFLKNELQKTLQIKKIIQPTEQELEEKKLRSSGTTYLVQPYGKNWLAVGDAAFSYDPISSYGITSALATGFYGAHAIAAKLANEDSAFLAYRYVIENGARAYLQKLTHQYQMEKRWRNSYYWQNRLPKE
ncbi:MAG: flavin-dependent dehydrogenase [Aureispira sp.]|jgi:flavin-dependent dehydrogenase